MKSKPTYKELEKEIENLRKEKEGVSYDIQKKFFNSINDGIYINSPDYKIEYLNVPMIKMLGGDKTGQMCYKAIYNKDKICEWCIFKKLKKNDTITHELKHPSTNNTYVIKNFLLENGSKLTSYHDISQFKEKEFQLQKQNTEYEALNEEYKSTNEQLITAKEKVEKSEKQYRDIIESTSEGCWVLNKDKITIDVNTSLCTMLEYSRKEMIGKSPIDFVDEENAQIFKYQTGKIAKTNQRKYEISLKSKSGENIPVIFNATTILDEKAEVFKSFAFITDITDRKEAEQKLIDTKNELSNSQQIAKIGSWELNLKKQIITLSAEHKILIGEKPQKTSMPLFDYAEKYIVPEDVAVIQNRLNFAIQNIKNKNYNDNFEYRLKTTKNEIKYFAVKSNFKTKGVITGVTQDITDRKEAEKALKENENKFKSIFDYSPNPIAITDIKGEITDINKEFCNVTMYSKDEIVGRTTTEVGFYSKKNREQFIKELNNEGKVEGLEIDFILKDNSVKTTEMYSNIIHIENIPYILSSFIDITDSKKAKQDIIIAKEKAEESDRLKSAFLANMSHEIRTPMNSILGFAGILKKTNKTEKQKEHFINVILKNGNHLLNLINEIIDISKIDANQLTVIEKELNLNTFILQVCEVFKNQLNGKVKLVLDKKLQNGNDIIITDETRLQQILTNLIGNAVKFTSSGTIEIGYSIKNNMIEFSVKDTGIGISENELQFVFDRFRQADETSTRKYGGTGLGLAISKACAELLDGKIWVKSEHGKGSTFYFTIKYKPAIKYETTLKLQDNLETENLFEGKTILIAEDDLFSFEILELYLEPTNANIIHATDGLKAIDLCKNNPQINIVLMDIQLPKLNGLEATKEILKFRPNLPIISQTANAMREDENMAFEAGCVDYVSKPISEETLLEIINKNLRTNR